MIGKLSLLVLFGLLAVGESYNYFNLVRQWTPNMCYKAKKSCRNMPSYVSEWTVHGLWPSYNEYDWPEDCQNHCVLRSSEISHLEREMNREWPTSYSSQNYGFWRHEYCKHGTCCTDKFRTAADYFKGALNLHQKYDMDRALRNGGIVPSTAKAYRVSDFDRALKTAFGVSKVGYWCRFAKDNKGIYRQLLWQVSLCISKSLNVVECPADDDGACNRNKPVLYLPYSVL
ncbi:ribonuclease Oy-like [Bolinopsis microptera]|uniref:ribonuclease Oy-like n=1 Tax=Bolinopsis microptera TaxID=2820187 RepID=UPI003078EA37